MTLHSRMFIHDEVDVGNLFFGCQYELARFSPNKPPSSHVVERGESRSYPGALRVENVPGQGLPAWVWINYRESAPLRTPQEVKVCDKYCDPEECDPLIHDPAMWAEVNWDTAYGYSGPGGIDCGTLHATLIARVGARLDKRRVGWSWENEFTGQIHSGYEQLLGLSQGGFEAATWFKKHVAPTIFGTYRYK